MKSIFRAALAGLFLVASASAAAASAPVVFKDQDGSTFQITATPGKDFEFLATFTPAVAPAGCQAVGTALPMIGYTHYTATGAPPHLVAAFLVNWSGAGCTGITSWTGAYGNGATEINTTWIYVGAGGATSTGTSHWVLQKGRP